MNNFYYYVPTEVYFGKGQLSLLAERILPHGKHILMVYDGCIKAFGLYDKLTTLFRENGILWTELTGIEPNPQIGPVREGVRICKEQGVDLILAVGGGSTIDTCKTISAGARSDADVWDLIVHPSQIKDTLPVFVVGTIAATGSEMDCIAVISDREKHVKQGSYSTCYYPKAAFLDPENTFSVPPRQTAAGTADIMSHVFENYFSHVRSAYLQLRYCESILKTCIHYGPVALREPDNYEARANLMWSASWAMNGIVRLGNDAETAVHPLANTLTAHYGTTHGVALAILTPYWMEFCLNEDTLWKYVEFAVNVWGMESAAEPHDLAHQAIDRTRQFFTSLGLPARLSEVGVGEEKLELMADQAASPALLNAFVPMTRDDILYIYRAAL